MFLSVLCLAIAGCMGSPGGESPHGGFTGNPPPPPTANPAINLLGGGPAGFYISSGGTISNAPQVKMRASVGSPEQARMIQSPNVQGYIKIQSDFHDNF